MPCVHKLNVVVCRALVANNQILFKLARKFVLVNEKLSIEIFISIFESRLLKSSIFFECDRFIHYHHRRHHHRVYHCYVSVYLWSTIQYEKGESMLLMPAKAQDTNYVSGGVLTNDDQQRANYASGFELQSARVE